MVKLRLKRLGSKKAPTYRIVAADSRSPRDGRIIDTVGLYNPTTNPVTVRLDEEKALKWLKDGAQPTDTVRDILSKQGIKGPYKGVMPNRLSTFRSVLTDRIALQAKLEESIKNEDYEKAAIYRDYLKALEKSPVAGGEDE